MKKLLTIAMLGAVSVPMLVALGCSSSGSNQPYSLTGKTPEQVTQDREEHRQRLMYTDDKGHYRPDLRAQGRPLHDIPE